VILCGSEMLHCVIREFSTQITPVWVRNVGIRLLAEPTVGMINRSASASQAVNRSLTYGKVCHSSKGSPADCRAKSEIAVRTVKRPAFAASIPSRVSLRAVIPATGWLRNMAGVRCS
jgi:hypothetical protein